MEGKKFLVVGNSRYGHNFSVGQVVEAIREYADGALGVKGEFIGRETEQDMHPVDLETFKESDRNDS